jgi:hypothetical protein
VKDERQIVELVGIVATYNMVSRFLVALEIDLEGPRDGLGVQEGDTPIRHNT